MIIVSQDKKQILNFNNIQNIRIEPYGTHEKGKKIYKIFAGNFEGYTTKLGTYDTEERAKEVLQEIIEKICEGSNITMDIEGINCEVSKQIYYMPER